MVSSRKSTSAWLLRIFCFCTVIPLVTSKMMNTELRLITGIFKDYNTTVRPLKNSSETVHVQVSYFLSSIDNVDEKGSVITLSGWLHLEWTDEFLTWNPDEYDGMDSIVVPADKIWVPDLVFETGVKEKFFKTKLFWARISSSGLVAWEPGGTLDLRCGYDLKYYPCDSQTCQIKLVTWTNTGSKVYTYGSHIDQSYYEENGEWTLSKVRMDNYTFEEGGETYSEVHSFITIKRKPLFQVLNILLPVALLSVLNLLVFCVPPESEEKVSLSVTLLLAFSVWLLMMNGMMPSSSDYVPLMGIYITAFLVSSSVSVFISVMVLRVYEYPSSRPVPPWLVNILLKISDIRCRLDCPKKKKAVRPDSAPVEITQLPNLSASLPAVHHHADRDHDHDHHRNRQRRKEGSRLSLMEKEAKKRKVTWHQVANAIDMTCFIFFLLFFFVLTFVTVAILLYEFQVEQ